MKRGLLYIGLAVVFIGGLLFLPGYACADNTTASSPDKSLCAKMIQSGKQAYQAGRYLDAKEYFRKAIQADPSSAAAWEHYDLAITHALAEKVEKKSGLIAPDESAKDPAKAVEASPAPPQPQAPAKKPKFVIEEDEGC